LLGSKGLQRRKTNLGAGVGAGEKKIGVPLGGIATRGKTGRKERAKITAPCREKSKLLAASKSVNSSQ